MNAQLITDCFGRTVLDPMVQDLFVQLATQNRPQLPSDDKFAYHDWVLVRRKGVELGFADSQYHTAAPRPKWRHGQLMLTQAYFYAGFDEVRPFKGDLPYGLQFSDDRNRARQKLMQFEASRHSYLTDTWDVDGWRLQVQYTDTQPQRIDRMACRQLAAPIPVRHHVVWPAIANVVANFGEAVDAAPFVALWGGHVAAPNIKEAREDGSIDLLDSFGATLNFAAEGVPVPLFQSITLHRNRDEDSVGWQAPLPLNLDFEDSPETLFAKMQQAPVAQEDAALTGYAVWEFPACTLHVLYSNVDNRLLRIRLIAPGIWRPMAGD